MMFIVSVVAQIPIQVPGTRPVCAVDLQTRTYLIVKREIGAQLYKYVVRQVDVCAHGRSLSIRLFAQQAGVVALTSTWCGVPPRDLLTLSRMNTILYMGSQKQSAWTPRTPLVQPEQ